MKQTYKAVLEGNNPKVWKLSLGTLESKEDLFFTIQSPIGDPLQEPFLTISTSDSEMLKCDLARSEFVGVCRLGHNALRDNLTLFLTARCFSQCRLTISAAFQSRIQLTVDNPLILKTSKESAGEYELDMKVPLETDFTQLAIFVEITDFASATAGLELFANIGNEQTAFPSSQKYDSAGESIFWGGEGLFFARSDFSEQNSWIKIYLSLAAGMQAKVITKLTRGNDFKVQLGTAYFDYTLTQ